MQQFAINRKIHYVLTILLACCIPVYAKVIPVVIVLLAVNWVWYLPNIQKSYTILKSNYSLLAMVVLYLLNVIFLWNTENYQFAGEELQTKLSFLILPVIYAASADDSRENLFSYLKAFAIGCGVYAIMCLGYATYAYVKPVYTEIGENLYNFGSSYFYYTYLSRFFHPSYAAIHTVIGIYFIYYVNKKQQLKNSVLWTLLFAVLIVFVLMLSSKAGWISLAVVLLLIMFDLWKSSGKLTALGIGLFSVAGFLVLNVLFVPGTAKRIPKIESIENSITEKDANNQSIQTGSDGNTRRIFVWRASWEVFKEHPLTGVGTGDVKDVLLQKYADLQMRSELENKLNSHNQFFTNMIAFGFIGLITLLVCLYYPLKLSRENGEMVIGIFALIVGINCLFESLFERQDGVIVYAFFHSLFCSMFWTAKRAKVVNSRV